MTPTPPPVQEVDTVARCDLDKEPGRLGVRVVWQPRRHGQVVIGLRHPS